MRQCPTFEGQSRPLITHQIETDLCLTRQREFYHKCHRCVYRGKAAGFRCGSSSEGEPMVERRGVGDGNGVVEPRIHVDAAPVDRPVLVEAPAP